LIELAAGRARVGTLEARSALTSHVFTNCEFSFAYAQPGIFDASMERAQEVVRVAQSVGLVYFRALADWACGCPLLYSGEASAAVPFLESSAWLSPAAVRQRSTSCRRRIAPLRLSTLQHPS